jgi:hypothetical protein
MILLLASAIAASARLDSDTALQLCRPVLARKAGGDIQTISVTSARRSRNGDIIEGQLTAFIGMGAPPPGSASAHHLIRSDFHFRCRTERRRVREASVSPER